MADLTRAYRSHNNTGRTLPICTHKRRNPRTRRQRGMVRTRSHLAIGGGHSVNTASSHIAADIWSKSKYTFRYDITPIIPLPSFVQAKHSPIESGSRRYYVILSLFPQHRDQHISYRTVSPTKTQFGLLSFRVLCCFVLM